jgi:ribosomal protein S18 acetylase RimI-like enzyme
LDIRLATINDVAPAAELYFATTHPFGDELIGMGDHALAMRVIRGYFVMPGNRMSYQFSHVAELEGQVAGLLVVFPGRNLRRLETSLLRPSWKVYGWWNILRMALRAPFASIGKVEVYRDEFYVSNLATAPDFRRRGVGRALLAYADDLARSAGFHKVSLCVEIDNAPAYLLYQSHGYRVTRTNRTPWLERWLHTRGNYHMVKEL